MSGPVDISREACDEEIAVLTPMQDEMDHFKDSRALINALRDRVDELEADKARWLRGDRRARGDRAVRGAL
jgi:hypothetical protein